MNRAEELNITNQLLVDSAVPTATAVKPKVLYIIGADEAGRGPLCGPVVCGAAVLYFDNSEAFSNDIILSGLLAQLGDSKKINESTRDKLYAELLKQENNTINAATPNEFPDQNTCIATETVRIDAEEIDELNILEASLHGMERAADAVLKKLQHLYKNKRLPEEPSERNTVVLIDGPHLCRSLRRNSATAGTAVGSEEDDETEFALKEKNNKKQEKAKKAKKANPKAEREAEARTRILKPVFQGAGSLFTPKARAVVKGDAKCPCISAASILAKVKRDEIMLKEVAPNVDKRFDLENNKGYPTASHMSVVAKLGPTKYHRRSFTPVRLAMEKFEKKDAPKETDSKKKAKKQAVVVDKENKTVKGGKKKAK